MGRKIPGKKHNGVKDPEKQQIVRHNSIKDKINNPPANPNEQPIPKTLQKIINYKNNLSSSETEINTMKKIKSSEKLKQKPAKKKDLRVNKSKKLSPQFVQLPGETDKIFLKRVNETVQNYLKEAQYENKFEVEIKRNEITGSITGLEKRKKDEIDVLMKKSRQKNVKKGKNKKFSEELSKSQKKSKKLTDKKEQKELNKINEIEKMQDEVKFGEIVSAPPTLTLPKKFSKTNVTTRPGKRDLLLKKVLSKSAAPINKMPVSKVTVFQKLQSSDQKPSIERKGVRKELPIGVRRQLDNERTIAIDAYRKRKTDKLTPLV